MGTDDLFKKRKAARKARTHATREPKPGSYLIVAEGKRTEPAYFQGLGAEIVDALGGVVDVQVEGQGRGTTALVERASQIVSRSPRVYEHVWVAFDKDDFDDFDEAISLAEARGYEVAWSNPSFEYWLFLHFDYADSALHRHAWEEKVDSLFKSRGVRREGYQKNLADLYQLISQHGDVSMAIRSAKAIHRKWDGCGEMPSRSDPCTTVYQLVEQLRSYLDEEDRG